MSEIKTRQGSGYLKQLYATARTTVDSTHSHLKGLTTFLVNFVPIEQIDPSEHQVRTHFDEDEISALSHSIREHGVFQPILIIQNGDRYQVIAGERRLRAAQKAGLERIPARVLASQDKVTQEIALRENLDRVDLHPIEEGEGYLTLLEAGAYTSHESIATAFGKPKSRITECIGFTRLPLETKNALFQNGLKNRSLLRELLNASEKNHPQIIHQALNTKFPDTTETTNKLTAGTKQPTKKTFTYLVDHKKGVSASAFKWKKSDGIKVLTHYQTELQKLMKQIEELIQSAQE